MATPKYFKTTFAASGDVLPIPDAEPLDGSISYQSGFGPDYALDLTTDPNALAVPRPQTNQLLKDITENIQQYQQYGNYDFITPTMNGGTPFGYSAYAVCLYDVGTGAGLEAWMSVANANTSEPGTGTWAKLNHSVPFWYTGLYYNTNDVINYNGTLFKSLIDNNTAHTPPDSPTQWAKVIDDTIYGTLPKQGLGVSAESGNLVYIWAGSIYDTSGVYKLTSSFFSKGSNSPWAAGSDPSYGAWVVTPTAGSFGYVFIIRKDSDGSIDFCIDNNINATNRPAGYSIFRAISLVYVDSISGSDYTLRFTTEQNYTLTINLPLDTHTFTLTSGTEQTYGVSANPILPEIRKAQLRTEISYNFTGTADADDVKIASGFYLGGPGTAIFPDIIYSCNTTSATGKGLIANYRDFIFKDTSSGPPGYVGSVQASTIGAGCTIVVDFVWSFYTLTMDIL